MQFESDGGQGVANVLTDPQNSFGRVSLFFDLAFQNAQSSAYTSVGWIYGPQDGSP